MDPRLVELELFLVLILDHVSSTVDRLGASLFLKVGTIPAQPVTSVGNVSSVMFDYRYKCGWLVWLLNSSIA